MQSLDDYRADCPSGWPTLEVSKRRVASLTWVESSGDSTGELTRTARRKDKHRIQSIPLLGTVKCPNVLIEVRASP